ncbi:tagaturonate reductase [Paenibacillaceae bacterium]|nr:tagaturonate reductase [Paenibacillaceae bacterium]
MKPLSATLLSPAELAQWEELQNEPAVILQIGEGNFMRGFIDWMIHECRERQLFKGSVVVTQPRPAGRAKLETLRSQDGLYTLITRGLENGEAVERKQLIPVFGQMIDPYAQWDAFMKLADHPELKFVVSNTTEAGLVYREIPYDENEPTESFPAKLTLLLYRRFRAFGGDPERGLIMLPCELLERNGDELKQCVLRHCADWELPAAFTQWLEDHNRFLNSLVDRIVTGYPAGQAEAWFEQWGYEDKMLNTAEPYHFWAIEAEPELDQLLPLRQAGLNVHWVADLTPYQLRKVRILNGAHTLMTPLALLRGCELVREVMEHPAYGAFVRDAVSEEIIPTLPLPEAELHSYAESVYERYLNPYIDHRLYDIAMNSLSKFKARLLPTLLYYTERQLPLPKRLVLATAALIRYYKVKREGDAFLGTTLDGTVYTVRDDKQQLETLAKVWQEIADAPVRLSDEQSVARVLEQATVWGRNLAEIDELSAAVAASLTELEAETR